MTVLLVFNELSSATVKQIGETTKMKRDVLVPTLQSLVKMELLKGSKDFAKEEDEDASFSLNTGFSNKKMKVSLGALENKRSGRSLPSRGPH